MATQGNASKVFCTTLQQSFRVQNDTSLTSTIILAVLQSASCSFTVVINLAIIIALLRKEQLKTAANLILTSMAISDFLVGLIVQPLTVTHQIFNIYGNDSCFLQNISSLVAILCVGLSFVNVCMFAMDRCFAAIFPFKYLEEKIYRKYLAIIIVSWLAIGILVVLTYMKLFSGGMLQRLMTVLFIISMVFTLLSYFIIYGTIRRQKKRISNISSAATKRFVSANFIIHFKRRRRFSFRDSTIDFPQTFVSPRTEDVIKIEDNQVVKIGGVCDIEDASEKNVEPMINPKLRTQRATSYTVLVILAVFMLCYLPLTVLNVITKNTEIDEKTRIVAYNWANFLIVFNSSLNPIIYCIRVKMIRNEVKATFSHIFRFPISS